MFTRRTLIAALVAAMALVSAVQAQVKLTRKVPQGKRIQVSTSKTEQKITIAGMDIPTVADVVTTEEYTYTLPEADGTRRVTVKDAGMIFKLKVQGNDIVDYDSAKPDEAKATVAEVQTILEGFKVLNGKTRTLVYDKDGKLKAVEGVEAILAQLPAGSRAEIEQGFSKTTIEAEAKKDLDRIPDRELKKGDKWQVTEIDYIGQGQTLTFDMYYEYQGSIEKDGRTLDKISIYAAGVKYAQREDAAAQLKVVNSDLKIESSMGMLYFDREKGDVTEVSRNVRITGPMTFSVNGMELPGKLDLNMDTQTIVK